LINNIDDRPPLTAAQLAKDPNESTEENMALLRRNSIQKLFNGYEYDIEQVHH
jgi:hypothetical protein